MMCFFSLYEWQEKGEKCRQQLDTVQEVLVSSHWLFGQFDRLKILEEDNY